MSIYKSKNCFQKHTRCLREALRARPPRVLPRPLRHPTPQLSRKHPVLLRTVWTIEYHIKYFQWIEYQNLVTHDVDDFVIRSRERIREGLPPQFRSSPLLINLSDFLSGAVLGAFISTVFFPVNVTKTHMQLVVGGEFIR